MIDAMADERLEVGASAKLEPGTLRLRRTKPGEHPVFLVTQAIEAGQVVAIVPLDPGPVHQGTLVRGATVVSGASGVEGLVTPQTGE